VTQRALPPVRNGSNDVPLLELHADATEGDDDAPAPAIPSDKT
jgi:hypothetical protein